MYDLCFNVYSMQHFVIHSVLYLTMVKEKYMKMYERFIKELKTYSKVIRIL